MKPGWYPSPAGEAWPWYFNGTDWEPPALRFDLSIDGAVNETAARMGHKLETTKAGYIRRRYFFARIRAMFR